MLSFEEEVSLGLQFCSIPLDKSLQLLFVMT